MRSSLRVLSLRLLENKTQNVEPFFSHITAHRQLEELRLAVSLLYEDEWLAPFQWHALRKLEISGKAPPLGSLVAAFPNLRSLCIRDIGDAVNIPSSVQWSGLDYLRGDCAHLCQSHIQCPVRWLDLPARTPASFYFNCVQNNFITDGALKSFASNANFVDLLEWTKPLILTVTVRHDVDADFWEKLVPVTRQVKLLELTIWLGPFAEDGESLAFYSQILGHHNRV